MKKKLYLLVDKKKSSFKIGIANNVVNRIKEFGKKLSYYDLNSSYVISSKEKSMSTLEQTLHFIFCKYNIDKENTFISGNTEWFNYECFDMVLNEIKKFKNDFKVPLTIKKKIVVPGGISHNMNLLREELKERKFKVRANEVKNDNKKIYRIHRKVFRLINNKVIEMNKSKYSSISDDLCFSFKLNRSVCDSIEIFFKEFFVPSISTHGGGINVYNISHYSISDEFFRFTIYTSNKTLNREYWNKNKLYDDIFNDYLRHVRFINKMTNYYTDINNK